MEISPKDAQNAKLQGLATAPKMVKHMLAKDFTVRGDCKNAVDCSNKACTKPQKHAKESQSKYSEVVSQNHKGKTQKNRCLTDLADNLATATQDWELLNSSTCL